MRVLLDECLPWKLKRDLAGHEAATVADMGWRGIKNGALLRLAATQFDVLLTIDQNLPYQQNITSTPLAVVMLTAHSNRLLALRPLIPRVLSVLQTIQPGTVVRVALESNNGSAR
jgi:predicted nuclease of predicted toxin-antitoxin system